MTAKPKPFVADYDEGDTVLVVPGDVPVITYAGWNPIDNCLHPHEEPRLDEQWRGVKMPFVLAWKRHGTVRGYLYPPGAVDEINACDLRVCVDLPAKTAALGVVTLRARDA